jgi:hypothetical protein
MSYHDTQQIVGGANGGGYRIIQLPKVTDPMPPIGPPATAPAPGTTPAGTPDLSNLLDGQVLGIPVKYLVIGAALYFFVLRKH